LYWWGEEEARKGVRKSSEARQKWLGVGPTDSQLLRYDTFVNYAFLITAFLVCAGLHWMALKEFPVLKLLDKPEKYGHKRDAVPYPTGIIAVLCFIGFFAAIAPWTKQSAGLLLGILFLAYFSFLDDRYPVNAKLRLAAQALAAFAIFATGARVYTITNPLEGILGMDAIINLDTIDIPSAIFGPLPLWSGVFTILWLMFTTNALNWFDGIPGQVSVLSTIGFLTIGFLSLSDRVNQPELATIAFLLAAISGACLLFDFPPNKVLMGDTGAMFFGLMLGVLTVYSGGKVATAFLVLGVPLIDLAIVIIRRLSKGASIFRGDTQDEHLHHRLLRKGWNERQIIFLTAGLGTAFGITALFLSTQGKFIAAIVLFAIMLFLSRFSAPTNPSTGLRTGGCG
jgi:UDP-GlcNAc:undecaprenyl-phosphate GlcNAc-1-phosphate transferase